MSSQYTSSPVSQSDRSLPVYPERAVSVSSYHDYSAKPPVVGGNIVPVSTLNRGFVSPEPTLSVSSVSPPPQSVREHSRDNSTDSLLSLPVPPRRARSPPQTYRQPTPNTIRNVSSSSDLDVAGWLSQQRPDGSMPRGPRSHHPLGSAVTPSFPSLPSGPRPLLLLGEAASPQRSAYTPSPSSSSWSRNS